MNNWALRLFNIYENDGLSINKSAYLASDDNYYPGAGLAQWTGPRAYNLYQYAVNNHLGWGSIDTQTKFLWYELTNIYTNTLSSLKTVSSIEEAVRIFNGNYIVNSNYSERTRFANDIYNEFSGKGIGGDIKDAENSKAKNFINIALSQVGNYRDKYTGSYSGAWCTLFVKWCMDSAGISDSGYDSYTDVWINHTQYQKIYSINQMRPGDIVFMNWDDNYDEDGYDVDHVGIIVDVDVQNNTIETVEGNASRGEDKNNYVTKGSRYIDTRYIAVRVCSGTSTYPNNGGAYSEPGLNQFQLGSSTTASNRDRVIEYAYKDETIKKTRRVSTLVTADADANVVRKKQTSLLDTPTLVEAPFIILKIDKYTFGSYSKNNSFLNRNSQVTIDFPNYVNSMNVKKINGTVNQYTFEIVYKIQAGNDPNLLDKIFSKVGYGKIKVSYGDWKFPKFIYREEECIITKLTSRVEFSNSRISYTLSCTSNALKLLAGYFNFPARRAKPSDVIKEMLFDEKDKYGLQNIFTGFKNNPSLFTKWTARDDVTIDILAKNGVDALTYINYLVSCMTSSSTPYGSPIRDANYYLTICDDVEYGTYFKITKLTADDNSIALNGYDTYEVDIGYPGDTLVSNFSVNTDNSWSLLYNYSDEISENNYTYNIDSEGNIEAVRTPNAVTSSTYLKTTETQRNWWTQMTQFPVSASLEIKGLLRPAMLMQYVRVNALFYGMRHVTSGLYVITAQEDSINTRGYRTRLQLLRVAGDLDIISTKEETITKTVKVKDYDNTKIIAGGLSKVNIGFGFNVSGLGELDKLEAELALDHASIAGTDYNGPLGVYSDKPSPTEITGYKLDGYHFFYAYDTDHNPLVTVQYQDGNKTVYLTLGSPPGEKNNQINETLNWKTVTPENVEELAIEAMSQYECLSEDDKENFVFYVNNT